VARCFLEVHIGLAGCIRALRSTAFTSNTQKQTSQSGALGTTTTHIL